MVFSPWWDGPLLECQVERVVRWWDVLGRKTRSVGGWKDLMGGRRLIMGDRGRWIRKEALRIPRWVDVDEHLRADSDVK